MSSVRLYQGLEEKPSSRVLQPPGGGASNIFGTDAVATPQQKQTHHQKSDIFNRVASEPSTPAANNTQSRPTGAAAAPFASDESPARPQAPVTKTVTASPIVPPPAEPVASYKPVTTSNPITGEVINTSTSTKAATNVPSTRVRQPPGGASSGLW